MTKVSEVNGTVLARTVNSRNKTTREYRVTLFRGTEEKLLKKLNGDIMNLLSFCDNGFNFNDLSVRHFGGIVEEAWESRTTNSIMTSYGKTRPSNDSLRVYIVTVYVD